MSDQPSSVSTVTVESPPPAAQPEQCAGAEARTRLNALAAELARAHNRRLLIEFLRLRRHLGAALLA